MDQRLADIVGPFSGSEEPALALNAINHCLENPSEFDKDDVKKIVTTLNEKMTSLALDEKFEDAAAIRNQLGSFLRGSRAEHESVRSLGFPNWWQPNAFAITTSAHGNSCASVTAGWSEAHHQARASTSHTPSPRSLQVLRLLRIKIQYCPPRPTRKLKSCSATWKVKGHVLFHSKENARHQYSVQARQDTN